MMKRITKVVWLCNFANKEVAELVGWSGDANIAPWITSLIELFRNKQDIELYIVAPNYYFNNNRHLKLGNINVELFSYRPFYLPKRLLNFSVRNFSKSRRQERQIIERIQPDIIHLFGAENPMYAYGALDFMRKIPVLVSIQGYVFMSSRSKNIIKTFIRNKRIDCEREINSNASFFTVNNPDSIRIVREFNRQATIYRSYYPTVVPDAILYKQVDKIYDIVYCAKITREKGIEDLIEAVRIIKARFDKIQVAIIGGGSEYYVHYIQSLVERYGLGGNFIFKGFLSEHKEIFHVIARSKVFVLPTYFDNFPGSIREAMLMKVPVVSYNIDGISFINEDRECIALAEKQNVQELANKIFEMLSDTMKSAGFVDNAFDLMTSQFSNEAIYTGLIDIYQDIHGHKFPLSSNV